MKSSQSSGGAALAVLAARAGCAARSTAAATASGAQNIARRSMVTPGASSLVSAIAGAIEDTRAEMSAQASVPNSGLVWWLAQLRARREAAEAANRPMIAVQAEIGRA